MVTIILHIRMDRQLIFNEGIYNKDNNDFAFTINVKFAFTVDNSDTYTLNTSELPAYFTGHSKHTLFCCGGEKSCLMANT